MTEVVAAVGVFLQHKHLSWLTLSTCIGAADGSLHSTGTSEVRRPKFIIGLLEPRRDARTMFQRPW